MKKQFLFTVVMVFYFCIAGPVVTYAQTYEAENGLLNGFHIATNHTGYTGTGFLDNVVSVGNYVQFSITGASAGSQNIKLRYSNGGGSAQTLSLYVNGSKVRQVSFPNIGSWDTWADKVDNVTLNAGNNTIKYIVDSGDNGQINIDYLSLNASQNSGAGFNVKTQFGVNLSCGEFGGGSGGTLNSTYTYPTIAELDYYKSKGLTLIRMPFVWDRVQHTLGGPLDVDVDLPQIKTFVKAAQDRGINVMLDMHNYARRKVNGVDYLIGQTPNLTIAHFVDFWTKMAIEFKDYTNIWGYDLMNEPCNMGTVSWFDIAQAAVSGIRTVDVNTPIIIEGDSWASSNNWLSASDNLKNVVDPSNKLIYEGHCYFDDDASGIYNGTYDEEIQTANIALIRLKPFVDWLKLNNKVGMIGECGVPGNDPRWLTMLDGALTYLRDNNVSFTYWAAGPWWGTYPLSIEPVGTVDKPQMAILEKYSDDKISAIQKVKSIVEISISPNPATDIIRIMADSKIKHITIYNVQGISVLQKDINMVGNQCEIKLSQFVAGTYFVNVILEDNSIVIKKVVKI